MDKLTQTVSNGIHQSFNQILGIAWSFLGTVGAAFVYQYSSHTYSYTLLNSHVQ